MANNGNNTSTLFAADKGPRVEDECFWVETEFVDCGLRAMG